MVLHRSRDNFIYKIIPMNSNNAFLVNFLPSTASLLYENSDASVEYMANTVCENIDLFILSFINRK